MGAWSENLLDNDDAGDFKFLWDDFVAPLIESGTKAATPEFIFDLFKRLYFHGHPDFEDSVVCSQVLAMASLFKLQNLPITGELKEWVEIAVNVELRKDRLREWDSPRKRKGVLERLLKEIGGIKRVMESKAKELLKDYKEFSKQLLEGYTISKADDELERLYPRFLKDIEKCVDLGLSLDDHFLELRKHRLMQLAFFVANRAELSEAETLVLIRKAEKTKGAFLLS